MRDKALKVYIRKRGELFGYSPGEQKGDRERRTVGGACPELRHDGGCEGTFSRDGIATGWRRCSGA